MNKFIKWIINFMGVIALGITVSALTAYLTNYFKFDFLIISNYLLFIGLTISIIGAGMVVVAFEIFKHRLKKNPIWKQKNNESDDDGNSGNSLSSDSSTYEAKHPNKAVTYWGYILFLAGIVMFLISYYIAFRYASGI